MQPVPDNVSNFPAFLTKLWEMVRDPKTDHLICWSASENSFIIQNRAQFWYELLPVYYKHNNMSSFVRQLNMYGFHKISTVDTGSLKDEKDELQFYHPYFQKDKPELLKLIKRKVTVQKSAETTQITKNDDLEKVLVDVKQLRGRQNSVDAQLAAMKQENAVLWRELAVLRQKHSKQQQIVNKLIQFLVSMVHSNPHSRMGVGVKRRYPLMLRGSPSKKPKSKEDNNLKSKAEGPTIHELDSELDISSQDLFDNEEEEELPLIDTSPMTDEQSQFQIDTSPTTDEPNEAFNSSTKTPSCQESSPLINSPPDDTSSLDATSPLATDLLNEAISDDDLLNDVGVDSLPDDLLYKQEFEEIPQEELDIPESTVDELLSATIIKPEENSSLISIPVSSGGTLADDATVFINLDAQDTFLSNIAKGNYNVSALNEDRAQKTSSSSNSDSNVMTVAKIKPDCKINSSDDLDSHLEGTQSELDQLKDILGGCSTFDANALLGLFAEEYPEYGLSFNQNNEDSVDPMMSGSELAPYNLTQFDDLFDDSLDCNGEPLTSTGILDSDLPDELNTPQVSQDELKFPTNLQ